MEKRKKIALSDDMLGAVSGGADSSGNKFKTMKLSDLSPDEIPYYLMGQCPKCKGPLTSDGSGNFQCETCKIVYQGP